MLKRKLVKLSRQFRWSLPLLGAVPIHWHVGRPNFGDDLNPLFFSRVFDASVCLSRNGHRERILGMGSILHKSDARCHVVGSGLLDPFLASSIAARSVLSLRGQLSADATGLAPEFLGDPAIFLPELFDVPAVKTHRYGYLPHHSESREIRGIIPKDWKWVDPSWSPLKVLASIRSCENLLSRSLHGLICADAFGVPNAWLRPTEGMEGGKFKFLDYYSTVSDPKQPLRLEAKDFQRSGKAIDFSISKYRFNSVDYLAAIRQLRITTKAS